MYSTTIVYLAYKCQQIHTKFKYNIRVNQWKVTNLEQPFYSLLRKSKVRLNLSTGVQPSPHSYCVKVMLNNLSTYELL